MWWLVDRYFADNVRDDYANGQLDAQVEQILGEMRDLSICGSTPHPRFASPFGELTTRLARRRVIPASLHIVLSLRCSSTTLSECPL